MGISWWVFPVGAALFFVVSALPIWLSKIAGNDGGTIMSKVITVERVSNVV